MSLKQECYDAGYRVAKQEEIKRCINDVHYGFELADKANVRKVAELKKRGVAGRKCIPFRNSVYKELADKIYVLTDRDFDEVF